ncbi:ABC transporter ATP-binding protein [Verminephrobacter aporrectodeae subsp. tuberculatae]|uniref:ABC transporter ATP-binding protein n=1 Tax=Verminephrobacter aporrectodeae TaxID=1110389 RepID=UPI002237A8E0|nr:ABC transporter ATP-binding protein [Verminephrobacter aporrectodeae]MCW5221600.1 ABC transporter ATP-binding protein [Verminephrobacter aporrectodeae subsp. tuberculatae]MCW5290890.1 ABC transporter ATP-binding protein [Verminephrobacter aporrectodeae subsp. tuberculatae]
MAAPLLEFDDFRLHFDTFDGCYQALDGVTLSIAAGESLGIVGETGCGKSVTAKSVLGLVSSPSARIAGGDLRYRGQSLLGIGAAAMRRIRGVEIAMIFQDPMSCLNPLFTIGDQMSAVIAAHDASGPRGQRRSARQRRSHAAHMLARVHMPSPDTQLGCYPHQLSGGQRQRVLIAMALSGAPSLLIADEPTTALDVTIQAQILDLLDGLRRDLGLSILLISHDLGVISRVCDRVAVMYAGTVVETAPVEALFERPRHPYTRGLLASVPHPRKPAQMLAGIPGTVPNLLHPPAGCRYQARCPQALPACAQQRPVTVAFAPQHSAACLLLDETHAADTAARNLA